jgi:uncharacterized protein (DUF1778 family)
MAAEPRKERIEMRVPAQVKADFVRAVRMEHRSMTDVLIEYIRRATEEILARHQRIVLADEDWQAFTAALENPPEPGPALRRAMARFRERYGG